MVAFSMSESGVENVQKPKSKSYFFQFWSRESNKFSVCSRKQW